MVDGARNALLGYLYQLLGTAAVSVRRVESSDDAIAQFIASVGPADVASEEFGQDATLHPAATPGQGVTAIQFKHSATAGNLIERSELIDILIAFDRSRAEAASNGVRVENFAIVTNRQLDPHAQRIVDHRAQPSAHPSLRLVTSRSGEPVAGNVNRLGHYGGDRDCAAAAWHSIVQKLRIFPGVTFEAEIHRLRDFAERYGVLNREWDECLNSLVGAFVRGTAQGQPIPVSTGWLKQQMIGDSDAANLRFGCRDTNHITAICLERLNDRAAQQHRVHPNFYLEREVQHSLQSQLELYPVVFVTGGGGRGKSLAVVNYLRSVANRQMVWSESALTASEAGLVAAVTKVRLPRGQRSGDDNRLSDIRSRLDVANRLRGPARPLWTIDLDGIDEAPERVPNLRELINLCWAHGKRDDSPASIVVTCRSDTGKQTRAELISRWLGTPEPSLIDGVGVVELGNFTDDELVDAALLLNGAPEHRIAREVSPDSDGKSHHGVPVREDILLSLRHPVVWGAYAALRVDERDGILNGDQDNLNNLAKQLYERFLGRCRTRQHWKDNLMVERALPTVAKAVSGVPPYASEAWDEPCQSCLGRLESRELYAECLSYGLIERDEGKTWRWGHPFLADYLAAIGGEEENE